MDGLYERTAMLIGDGACESLKSKCICIFGVGGVGSFTAEAAARAGIGSIHLVDSDTVSDTNRNRQITALASTIGMQKTEVMKKRILDINPLANVTVHNMFFLPENADEINMSDFDYVIDAVDTVTAKIEIAVRCENADIPVISCMGTGNKLDPSKLAITDIYNTSVCPLARIMRKELRERSVKKLKVLYSTEPPIKTSAINANGKPMPGSISFLPSCAGLMIAGEMIKELCGLSR